MNEMSVESRSPYFLLPFPANTQLGSKFCQVPEKKTLSVHTQSRVSQVADLVHSGPLAGREWRSELDSKCLRHLIRDN